MIDSLADLASMGAALGALRWVQGPGGNVSVKPDDGALIVKASGARLRDVALAGGHVVVPLSLALAALDGNAAADAQLFAHTPRPSLETYFHALAGRVVAHTHALGALLVACSTVRHSMPPNVVAIPYARPGRSIAIAVSDADPSPGDERAFVLRSHGMVAIAHDARSAIALTHRIDALARHAAGVPQDAEPRLEEYLLSTELAIEGGFARALPPRDTAVSCRYLFPDAVVYASTVRVASLVQPEAAITRALATMNRAAIAVDSGGRRVAFAPTAAALRDAVEVIAAHDWVESALGSRAVYLDDDEPARIVNLPAEQYRIHATRTNAD